MGTRKEIGSRTLIDGISDFLRAQSPNRNVLVDLIKEYLGKREKSVSLCFRGNYATLYYRSKQLLKIVYKNQEIRGLFNFRYALPNPNADKYRRELVPLGVRFGNDERNISVILEGSKKVESVNLKEILKDYIALIDFWIAHRKKGEVRESDRQQELFALGFGGGGQTYFDIEYREPRETLIKEGYYDYAGGDLETKKAEYQKHSGGRFDLLGLRQEEGGYVLQFTEVKSTTGACDGKAGVLDHIRDYTKYCAYNNLVDKRKSDAVYTVNLLSEILGKGIRLTEEDIIGYEIVFIFTDGAVKKVKQYREALQKNHITVLLYDGNLNRIE